MERVTWRDESKHVEQFNFSDGNRLWCWLGFCVVSALRDLTVTSLQHHTSSILHNTLCRVCLNNCNLLSRRKLELVNGQVSSKAAKL